MTLHTNKSLLQGTKRGEGALLIKRKPRAMLSLANSWADSLVHLIRMPDTLNAAITKCCFLFLASLKH